MARSIERCVDVAGERGRRRAAARSGRHSDPNADSRLARAGNARADSDRATHCGRSADARGAADSRGAADRSELLPPELPPPELVLEDLVGPPSPDDPVARVEEELTVKDKKKRKKAEERKERLAGKVEDRGQGVAVGGLPGRDQVRRHLARPLSGAIGMERVPRHALVRRLVRRRARYRRTRRHLRLRPAQARLQRGGWRRPRRAVPRQVQLSFGEPPFQRPDRTRRRR